MKMHRIPLLLSHAQCRHPLLQLPSVVCPASCHKHVLHIHKNTEDGNQRIQEHFTVSFKLRKASFKQESLTPCESPPLDSWEWEASLAHRKCSLKPPKGTRPVPSSTRSCPSHSPGLARANLILSMSWPEPRQSRGLPRAPLPAALRNRCLPDLCEEKEGFGGRNKSLFSPYLPFIATRSVTHRKKDALRVISFF